MIKEKIERIKRQAITFVKENQILIVNDLIFIGVGFMIGATVNQGKWVPVNESFTVHSPYVKGTANDEVFWSGADAMMNAINGTGWRLCKRR